MTEYINLLFVYNDAGFRKFSYNRAKYLFNFQSFDSGNYVDYLSHIYGMLTNKYMHAHLYMLFQP